MMNWEKRQDWPEWAKFSATNRDGTCWWYENEPRILDDKWCCADVGWAEQEYVWPPFGTQENWQQSLRRRP